MPDTACALARLHHPVSRPTAWLAACLASLAAMTPLQRSADAQVRSFSTPSSGDTLGYWQQQVRYRIVATLDEPAQKLRATGELTYVNHSPDTLRQLWLHQYLNAFRPGSQWSADDAREGRVRFQRLREPDYGYERFTAAPTVDGLAVVVTYPRAPDSTVVLVPLPRPLAPGDSVKVAFAWDARPSTVPRRQGRRGRQWDFAQWYPKIAVYDRGGWQPNPLRPAGELYGEFGTYDVTIVVRDDQVLMATGVPVSGDPGWSRAKRWGEIHTNAYPDLPPGPPAEVPVGHRAVRFLARDIHHFAWTASPDYRYEGGAYVRAAPASARFRTWDTVAVHVLYRPGDEASWGNGQAVNRTITALRWLESIYGPYAYPQMGNVHRLDGGGTEFPMLLMNGSASQGLILHEGGHVYSYGILANNEWNAGWMDEGLTSYQTSWASAVTPQERAAARATEPPRQIARGYRDQAATISQDEAFIVEIHRQEMLGRAQPIGLAAHQFSEFAVYNAMVYDRAELMYGQLRDALGDTVFRRFLQDYYARWALKHVDERAMRASAERSLGRDLGWFFRQWVHETGLLDYAIGDVRTDRRPEGGWLTRATVSRRGEYRHPMPVGAFAGGRWTIARAEPFVDEQTVVVYTDARPDSVWLDPLHTTADWDRRNDVAPGLGWSRIHHVFDWPFLDQIDRDRRIAALLPMSWYAEPYGMTLGLRSRSHYLGTVDRMEIGGVVTSRAADSRFPAPTLVGDTIHEDSPPYARVQLWGKLENPYLPWMSRPLIGYRAGFALLDGVFRLDASRTLDLSPLVYARGPRAGLTVGLTGAFTYDPNGIPEGWSDADLLEANATLSGRLPVGATGPAELRGRLSIAGGFAQGGVSTGGDDNGGYLKLEAEAVHARPFVDSLTTLTLRAFGGWASEGPYQRALYASTRDPMETFDNHWWRPRGAILKQRGINYLPLGGAGLRGYDPFVTLDYALAGNGDVSRRVWRARRSVGTLAVHVGAFGDAAIATGSGATSLDGSLLADAGIGASLRGRFYDREVRLRLDLPIWVHQPALAGGRGLSERKGDVALRWVLSTGEW